MDACIHLLNGKIIFACNVDIHHTKEWVVELEQGIGAVGNCIVNIGAVSIIEFIDTPTSK